MTCLAPQCTASLTAAVLTRSRLRRLASESLRLTSLGPNGDPAVASLRLPSPLHRPPADICQTSLSCSPGPKSGFTRLFRVRAAAMQRRKSSTGPLTVTPELESGFRVTWLTRATTSLHYIDPRSRSASRFHSPRRRAGWGQTSKFSRPRPPLARSEASRRAAPSLASVWQRQDVTQLARAAASLSSALHSLIRLIFLHSGSSRPARGPGLTSPGPPARPDSDFVLLRVAQAAARPQLSRSGRGRIHSPPSGRGQTSLALLGRDTRPGRGPARLHSLRTASLALPDSRKASE